MSATEQDNAPPPLDPFGNEICLLFLKYGKCRYKKKCKKSHIVPDKNAPIMQQVTSVAPEKSVVKEGPRIAFTVKKTPYARPSTAATSASSSTASNLKQISHQQQQQGYHQGLQRQVLPRQQPNTTELGSSPHTQQVGQVVTGQPLKSKDGATEAMGVDLQPPTTLNQGEFKKPRKPKAKRPPKVHVHRLLSSLFKTTISLETVAASRSSSSPTGYPGPPTKERQLRGNAIANRRKEHQGSKKPPFATPAGHGTTVSSNELEVADEKIENWYTTYKARLEPKTRRLMVVTKPTTARHQSQLKTMRKHHWECRTEIEQQLKRQVPTAFSLKIVRTRIDWERVAPYITLMIQAAFEMDIQNPHLPVIGTTLCALLEHKDLSGLACEELLMSWGLTGINARRFTSHLWEVMVAAAGEASVRGGKGFGMRVRQLQDKEDFKAIRARLLELNKGPT
ncbi:hypothetical protein K457DRAFT_28331 [Linnemannia elongata AG-77]|uniref:C3H1-type domain-containing protein n=1 Tax=Linnemannia elongata AG-77 TaxID=1314771 RepID=A0A197KDE3_9FUNG|nr:hypothetical protein K457DRAFT_28331 [Linnemannia elongata AG-77]